MPTPEPQATLTGSAPVAPREPPAAEPAAPPGELAPEPAAQRARPAPPPPTAPLAAGRLAVDAPDAVAIAIDGRRVGAPPLAGLRLPRGQHRIVAYYRDGRVGQKTVYVGDQDVSITFR